MENGKTSGTTPAKMVGNLSAKHLNFVTKSVTKMVPRFPLNLIAIIFMSR
jgi:hypothetical protein